MNTARSIGVAVLLAAAMLPLAGCNRSTEAARTAVDEARFANTQICYADPWIRNRAPVGACEFPLVFAHD